MADALIQELLVANNIAAWKAGTGSNNCTYDVASLSSLEKKIYRITTTIPCTLQVLEAFLTTPQNNKLYESTLERETLVLQHDDSSIWQHVFMAQGVFGARDFVFKRVAKIVEGSFSPASEKLIADASSENHKPSELLVMVSKSVDALPPQKGLVRGNILLHGYIAVPVEGPEPTVRFSLLASVDPKVNVPEFALESTWPKNCVTVAKIRELVTMLQNMAVNMNLDFTARRRYSIAPSSRPRESSVVSKGNVDDDRRSVLMQQDAPPSPATPPSPRPSPSSFALDRASMRPLLESPPAAPALPPPPPPAITPALRPTLKMLLHLQSNGNWVPVKTLENCLMEEQMVEIPNAQPRKGLRISTSMKCTLASFDAFLNDHAVVRKYDPMLDSFDVLSEGPAGMVLYTSYKQQTRFVAARDFCSTTARVVLTREETLEAGLGVHAASLVQSSVNSVAKPVVANFTRGTIHFFGYVAFPESDDVSSPTIKVYNLSCVDPGGSIPNWIVDAANAEACKKLALIRKLCEDRHRSTPAPLPERLAPPVTVVAPVVSKAAHVDPAPQLSTQAASPNNLPHLVKNKSTNSVDDDFHSCVDEDEFINDQRNLKTFYEAEIDQVIHNLTNLHCAPGWELESQTPGSNCKRETLTSSRTDKKAVRITAEFKCSLETFKSVIGNTEYLRKYDRNLDVMETLESPPYGAVMYTNYKTGKLTAPRDFCTLTCSKLLSQDEGAACGLFTKGFRAAAFVQSSVDQSNYIPKKDGYVRGIVHAYGYIAVAIPPEAKRVRVYTIALVDPCGSIPAKLVDMASADMVTSQGILRELCEAQEEGGKARAAQVAVSQEPEFPAIDEVPTLRKLARFHTQGEWSGPKHYGKVKVSTAPCDMNPDVTSYRLQTEILCNVETISSLLSRSDSARKLDPEIDIVRFLDGPPNATISYTSYRPSSKVFPGNDFLQMNVNKILDESEGAEWGLYTKGIASCAYMTASVNWSRGVPAQPNLTRATVFYSGTIAIATPPAAARVRVIQIIAVDTKHPSSKGSEQFVNEMVNRMSRLAALSEAQYQESLESLLPAEEPIVDSSSPSRTSGPDVSQPPADVNPPVAHGAATPPPAATLHETATDSPLVPTTAAAERPAVIPPLLKPLLKSIAALHQRPNWAMGKVSEQCVLETCVVEFTDKKAVRVTTDFKCSLDTFIKFVEDVSQVRKYDLALDRLDVFEPRHAGGPPVIYTSYKQVTRLVAPRDFCSEVARHVLPVEVAVAEGLLDQRNVNPGTRVLLQNGHAVTDARVPQSSGNLVRGLVLVYGYIVTEAPSAGKIKVSLLSCVDPSGKIPNWILDAANAEMCKTLAAIRKICEEMERK